MSFLILKAFFLFSFASSTDKCVSFVEDFIAEAKKVVYGDLSVCKSLGNKMDTDHVIRYLAGPKALKHKKKGELIELLKEHFCKKFSRSVKKEDYVKHSVEGKPRKGQRDGELIVTTTFKDNIKVEWIVHGNNNNFKFRDLKVENISPLETERSQVRQYNGDVEKLIKHYKNVVAK